MTLDAEDREYLLRLVRLERAEAAKAYEALRGEMLTLDRSVDRHEAELAPRLVLTGLRRQLVVATNAAERARARLRRAEGMIKKLEEP